MHDDGWHHPRDYFKNVEDFLLTCFNVEGHFGVVAFIFHGGDSAMAKKKAKKKAAPKKVVKKIRCLGKTKDGKRCKRMAIAPAKYCHLHKK